LLHNTIIVMDFDCCYVFLHLLTPHVVLLISASVCSVIS